MRLDFWKFHPISIIFALFFFGCSTQQAIKSNAYNYIDLDTIQAGQYDTGKMWTFDFPPIDYLKKTYGFTPSKEWFEKARLSTLRLPTCTASFVSEDGLVMTNHHCARAALDSVIRESEQLIDQGFYAPTLEEERRASGIYMDQLLIMEDVTNEVQQAFESGSTKKLKIINRQIRIQEIQRQYSEKYKTIAPQDSMIFNVISFYNGGRFSLYGYKRYTDIRLVYAPEESMAFFGGDPDNFTYPRYDFDCAFFRVYDNGKPLKTVNFFKFSPEGAIDGDVVFVIGNPGTTSRLKTITQLEFLRDYEYPTLIEMYKNVGKIYSAYVEKHPEEKVKYLNTIFGINNSRKAVDGYLNGLNDPLLMARKKDFGNRLKDAFLNKSNKKTQYGDPWSDIAEYQAEIAAITLELNALKLQGRYISKYLSLTADLVDAAYFSGDLLYESTKQKFYPAIFDKEIEKQLLAFHLETMKKVLHGKNEAFDKLIANREPEQVAEQIAMNSFLDSKLRTDALLAVSSDSILKSNDPLITFIVTTREHRNKIQRKYDEVNIKLQASEQVLGKLMYEIYGTQIPPDATFTLRIADGIIKAYEYNGTIAPHVTTFYGMYDRYYSFGGHAPWKLPERWVNPPASFHMNTPINLISTNDIIGGNSGSPMINRDLKLVGLVFDGNIESLPGNIIYDDTKNRTVSVHPAGILEGLEQIYKAERIVKELREGKIIQ
jgi:hypothetical protein